MQHSSGEKRRENAEACLASSFRGASTGSAHSRDPLASPRNDDRKWLFEM
jgi:hypothetical protein